MNRAISIRRNLIIFGIPLFIIGCMVFIAKTSLFTSNPNKLSIGITFDLLLTAPLIYFLLIRKTKIPKTTVVPFLILGLVIGSLILPTENQYYLNLFKTWVLPIIELSILSFVIYNLRKAIKHYQKNKTSSFDFFYTLKTSCYEILPKGLVIPVVTEIAIFYYGLLYWKKKELTENEFSYHKDSGTVALLIALLGVIAIETFALHILLVKWSSVAAWILTCLSLYSGFQILGFLKSMLKRPISIENNRLYLRYGIMSETTIELQEIDTIEISSKEIKPSSTLRKLSLLGELEAHNTIIHLKKENEWIGLYGIKRKYKSIAFHVDQKIEFQSQINDALNR